MIKYVPRVAGPLQWKGGLLAYLSKHNGSGIFKNNYRDINLGDNSGKNIIKLIRRGIIPIIKDIVGNSQRGSGFNGGETAIIHLYLQLITEYFISNKKSGANAFLDVASAFATVFVKYFLTPIKVTKHGLKA